MSIRLRFAMLIAGIVAIAVATTSLVTANRIRSRVKDTMYAELHGEALHIAKVCIPYLRERNIGKLQSILTEESRTEDIASIHITDPQGKVVASNVLGSTGKRLYIAQNAAKQARPIMTPVANITAIALPMRDVSNRIIGVTVVTEYSRNLNRAMSDAANTAKVIGAVLTVLSALVAYILVGYFIDPIRSLIRVIRRIGEGNYNSSVSLDGTPELREVGEALNSMCYSLRQHVDVMETLNRAAAELLTIRKMTDIARLVDALCKSLMNADGTIWVQDPSDNICRLVPGHGARTCAQRGSIVLHTVESTKVTTIGEGSDYPPGSAVSEGARTTDVGVIVPLQTVGGTVGVLVVEGFSGQSSVNQDQIDLSTTIANIIGPAVYQQVRSEVQTRSARMLQRILAPSVPPRIPGVDVAARYMPAEDIGRLGGDYYDFFRIGDDKWSIAMGDVSGKGLAASQYAAMAKYALRSYVLEYKSPALALEHANIALLAQMEQESFVTLFCGVLDPVTREIIYSRAGHPPPLVYSKVRGTVEPLGAYGPPAGMFDTATFVESCDVFGEGDIMVLYTDGLTEAHKGLDMFGEEGIARVVEAHSEDTAREIVDAVMDEVHSFIGGKLVDDAAIVVAKFAQI